MTALDNVTAQDVLAWARAQEPERVVGVCWHAHSCLIAVYARRVRDASIHVVPGEVSSFYIDDDCYGDWALAPDLTALARAFDKLGGPYAPIRACDLDFATLEAAVGAET